MKHFIPFFLFSSSTYIFFIPIIAGAPNVCLHRLHHEPALDVTCMSTTGKNKTSIRFTFRWSRMTSFLQKRLNRCGSEEYFSVYGFSLEEEKGEKSWVHLKVWMLEPAERNKISPEALNLFSPPMRVPDLWRRRHRRRLSCCWRKRR